MSLAFQESLSKLAQLSASKLDETSKRVRSDLAGAEWKMGICLLAMVRTGWFRESGYSTITEYAERVLSLSGKKLCGLLGAARALENLPLLSDAFQRGQVGWGKVRAIQSLATPETEREWLDFALAHSTQQVARKVAFSPSEWKRHRALGASLESRPMVSVEDVKEILDTKMTTVSSSSASEAKTSRSCSVTSTVETPSQPRTIRLVVELTPDEYALYEEAESRIRAQAGKRVSRARVVARMAETVLSQGSARARSKHQVLIHTCEGCRTAWYDNKNGVQPVSDKVLKEALRESKPLKLKAARPNRPRPDLATKTPPGDSRLKPSTKSPARAYIPTTTQRSLFARAAHRCERCGTKGGRLDIHHTTPVSEGGGNSLDELRLYCRACHTLHHETDISNKPAWRRARHVDMLKSRKRALGITGDEEHPEVDKVPDHAHC